MSYKAGIVGLCGAVALGVAVYCGGVVEAQAPATGVAVSRTRIAFVNLQEVMKASTRYKALQETLKKKDGDYMQQLKNKEERLKTLNMKFMAKETTDQEKSNIEAEARLIKVDMENITQEAKKVLIKEHDETVAVIYNEIYQVVSEYATANGIDIVLRFTEDWTRETYHKPERVVGRMQMPFWPMYYDRNLDITGKVNEILARKNAQAVAPPGAPGAPGNVVPAGGQR